MTHHQIGTLLLFFLLCCFCYASCCLYFKEDDFSNQTLLIRRGMEDYCNLDKTTIPGEIVTCADNATAMRVNNTHVLLYTKEGENSSFIMEYGRDGEPRKYSYPRHAASCCLYFKEDDFSNQTLLIRRGMEDYCNLDKTTIPGEIVTCADNATAMRVNNTHVLLYTKEGENSSFIMEYGRDGEPRKYSYPRHAEDDFSNQTLLIRRGMEDYCNLDKTTIPGENVTCANNATAMRVNNTHVLLYTKEGGNSSFIMEYGRDGEPGKYSQPRHAACPVPPVSPENLKEAAKNRGYYGLFGVPFLVVLIIIIIILIYTICKQGEPRKNYTGCVSMKSDYDKLATKA